jgi:hypothetical protein
MLKTVSGRTYWIGVFIRSWFWLHIVSVVSVVLQPTTPAHVLGVYSSRSFAVLLILLATCPLVWWATQHLAQVVEQNHSTFNRMQKLGFFGLCIAGLYCLWAIDLGPTNSYTVLRLYISVVVVTLALWALDSLPHSIIRLEWILGIGCCLLTLILALNFPGLLWTDEGFNSSVALSFVYHRGLVHPTFLGGVPTSGPIYSIVYMGLGIWYSIFGVELGIGRAFVFLIGLASLFLTYKTAKYFYSQPAAWGAIILAVFVILTNNVLRADIGVAFFLSVAFYMYGLAHRTQRQWLHLIVGLAIALSLDGHPNAYRFIVAFALSYLVEFAQALRSQRWYVVCKPLVYLLTGQVIGVIIYVSLYVFLEPIGFIQHLTQSSTTINIGNVPYLLFEQFSSFLRNAPLLFGCAFLGVIFGFQRWNPLDRLLIIVAVTSLLIFASTYNLYRSYYLLQSITLLALLAAGLINAIEVRVATSQNRAVLTGVIVLVLASSGGWLTQRFQVANAQSYSDALIIATQIRKFVPTTETVVGIDPFFLRMYDYPRFVELNAGIFLARYQGISEQAAWETLAPSSIIIVRGYPIAPYPALLDYATTHGFQRIHCWSTTRMGEVELFMRQVPVGLSISDKCDMAP